MTGESDRETGLGVSLALVARALPVLLLLAALAPATSQAQYFDLPKLLEPAKYGDILIDRASKAGGEKPVGFSHWLHRRSYSCRVCHFELGFALEVGATEITEAANRAGDYCGACHDGEAAFGHTEDNCKRCHSGKIGGSKKRFKELEKLPRAPFGNEIDWVEAVETGAIQPRQSLFDDDFEPIPFEGHLDLAAEWTMIPPAIFPHLEHQPWHDCATCHPDIFNVKKKTTEHFRMKFILDGKFCGVCHLSVAFPLNDCKRCHPGIKG